MKKATYYAVFEPSQSGYGVYFPDLPGCISGGEDFASAMQGAQEALGLHIWGMEEDGDEIPAPTTPPHGEWSDADIVPQGALIAAVTVYPDLVRYEMDNRSIRTNVSIPAWLKAASESAGLNQKRIPFEITADPFYSAANMEYLAQVTADIDSGKSVPVEHDLIEV